MTHHPLNQEDFHKLYSHNITNPQMDQSINLNNKNHTADESKEISSTSTFDVINRNLSDKKLNKTINDILSNSQELFNIDQSLVELAKNSQGSRIIQYKIEKGTIEERNQLFANLYGNLLELTLDITGN